MEKFCHSYLSNELCLIPVGPYQDSWNDYLKSCMSYLEEMWPGAYTIEDYDRLLQKRLDEGGRFLFFLNCDDASVGIANVYVTNDTLHIAEFGIDSKHRRRHLGVQFCDLLCRFGKSIGAEIISAEVDQNISLSNAFWISQGWNKDVQGERFRYWRNLSL